MREKKSKKTHVCVSVCVGERGGELVRLLMGVADAVFLRAR